MRHIAVDLVGDIVRLSRQTNGGTVTAAVAGRSTVDAEMLMLMLIDTIVTADDEAIPTDSELSWIELANSDVLAT